MDLKTADTAVAYREIYRVKFDENVSAGTKQPFLIPLHLLGLWVLPTLYLAIPHKNRPWLYRARWLVLAAVMFFNFNMILNVSSHQFASAYGAGLIGAWGIVWNLTILVWTKPQWEAKRVNIRRKRVGVSLGGSLKEKAGAHSLSPTSENGFATALGSGDQRSHLKTGIQEGNNNKKDFEEKLNAAKTTSLELNGHVANGHGLSYERKQRQEEENTSKPHQERIEIPEEYRRIILEENPSLRRNENGEQPVIDLEKLAAEQEFEYYWQEYPADAPFLTRLDWAFDIVSTFRMTGWNWAIPCVPPYKPPPYLGDYQLPLSAVGPQRTAQGYTRCLSQRELFLSRLLIDIIPNYLIVDFVAVYMTADPYFVLGPEHNLPLPPHLSSLHPLLLSAQRAALSFIGVISALNLTFNAGILALALLPPLPQLLRFRAHPWHLPSCTGSFTQVLDRGLAGFWGAWWHQTFRFGFSAPSAFLLRRGYIRAGTWQARAAGAACAFLTSGFLHASGSYSTVPRTKWWLPPLFFLLAGLGTTVQGYLCRVPFLRSRIARFPRWVRRAGNLGFVTAWMWMTSWALVDDFGRCGLWLYEPVPVSIMRALGVGPTMDRRVWRYELEFRPRWYWGSRRWWEIGLGI
ncbi:hypothetical protein F5Y04DRAFT_278582 [Hypomontagnella monticulosa]|nr:hypothetical protein F5Y04DRAFT_278582 [Hypomontagnella monticulosa]